MNEETNIRCLHCKHWVVYDDVDVDLDPMPPPGQPKRCICVRCSTTVLGTYRTVKRKLREQICVETPITEALPQTDRYDYHPFI